MKIKFSKVMAIVCAVSVAFAGLTAFAADATVTTTTTYDAYNGADEEVTVVTNVAGVTAGKEVTYYVDKAGAIVYINQKTATDGTTSFTFKAKQGDVLTATAKYGTDATDVAFPTFTFAEATNYLTQGTATATTPTYESITYVPYDEDGVASAETTGYAFKAKVSGAATEYGIKIGENLYPAAGCSDDGTYMVVIKGDNVSFAGKTVYAYAKDANGNVVPSASAFVIQ